MRPRRIKAMAKKEFVQMIRDIRTLFGGLFLPLFMIFLFGYAWRRLLATLTLILIPSFPTKDLSLR